MRCCSGLARSRGVLNTGRPAVRDVAGGDRDHPGFVWHALQRSAPLRLPGQPPPSLPVLVGVRGQSSGKQVGDGEAGGLDDRRGVAAGEAMQQDAAVLARGNRQLAPRSEEHTSELQSLMRISYAVFCLQKKKHITNKTRKAT